MYGNMPGEMNAIHSTSDAATGTKLAAEITDKRGFGQRWRFSLRHLDNLLAQGMPHLKIGLRRVRIEVAEADAWMRERFATRRLGPANTAGHPPHRRRRHRQPSSSETQGPITG